MSYIGNTNTTQAFTPAIDYFSGNGSTTAFTLSRPVASVAQVQVTIDNVAQNPSSAYTVSANTITFTSAPLSGTNNIYVYYTSPITQVIAPGQGTVGTTQIQNGVTVNFADGTAAAPSITNDGDTNTGIFFPAADTIAFSEGGAEAMRIDSSGKVLIGASSSDLSGTSQAMVIGSGGLAVQFGGTTGTYLKVNPGDANGVVNLTADARTGNYPAMTFTTSATERMRIDSSGNVMVGASSSNYRFRVQGAVTNVGEGDTNVLQGLVSTTAQAAGVGPSLLFVATYDGGSGLAGMGSIAGIKENSTSGNYAGALKFMTRPNGGNLTERMRITSGGSVVMGGTSAPTIASVGAFNGAYGPAGTGSWAMGLQQDTTSGGGGRILGLRNVTDFNNAGNEVIYYQGNATARFYVLSNGGIYNYSANNVNLSDRREKTNFAPSKSYLDTVCAIPVQTFNYIDQNMEEDGGLTLGVVAQDVQAVAPELVKESNWGTQDEPKMRLSIYQTDLQYALMKSIQELKAINDTQAETINALTARIVALENR